MAKTTTKETPTLNDRFLRDVRDARRQVSLYLISGFQLKGEVVEFDDETILFKHRDVHQLVMRSAVAATYPLPSSKRGSDEWWREYVSDVEGE